MVLNGVTLDRLADRKALLRGFDQFRRDVDSSGVDGGAGCVSTQQAFGDADLQPAARSARSCKEDKRVLERYGKGDPKPHGDAAPM